jgi:hypothetical protein
MSQNAIKFGQVMELLQDQNICQNMHIFLKGGLIDMIFTQYTIRLLITISLFSSVSAILDQTHSSLFEVF